MAGVLLRPCIASVTALGLWPAVVSAQVDPASGIDFVTITHPGNPAWAGDGTQGDVAIGRGSVAYEYRIGRYEVTTAQWAEFMNAAMDRPSDDRIPFVFSPTRWGAVGTAPQHGGTRFAVPTGNEMLPAGGIDWRTCAIYCNWLHNGKGTDRSAFLSGAYDVSTFGYIGNIFTDQLTHSPGARYWIPSWDEWLKAAHWSPANAANGGWYTYSNGTDVPIISGPPGVGQANYGFSTPNPFNIPLGAYVQTLSPWGLMDVAGGTSEWTESVIYGSFDVRTRMFDGSHRDSTLGVGIVDRISYSGGEFPNVATSNLGLRIAGIPSPASSLCVAALGLVISRRRRGA